MVIATLRHTSCTTERLWQWDYGQVLQIRGDLLPDMAEVHFSLSGTGQGESVTRIGVTQDGVMDVPIPDALLEGDGTGMDYPIFAYLYLSDSTSGHTLCKIMIPVRARVQPGVLSDDDVKDNPTGVLLDTVREISASKADGMDYQDDVLRLLAGEKELARVTITGGSGSGSGAADCLKYTEQELTDEQKQQVYRNLNITETDTNRYDEVIIIPVNVKGTMTIPIAVSTDTDTPNQIAEDAFTVLEDGSTSMYAFGRAIVQFCSALNSKTTIENTLLYIKTGFGNMMQLYNDGYITMPVKLHFNKYNSTDISPDSMIYIEKSPYYNAYVISLTYNGTTMEYMCFDSVDDILPSVSKIYTIYDNWAVNKNNIISTAKVNKNLYSAAQEGCVLTVVNGSVTPKELPDTSGFLDADDKTELMDSIAAVKNMLVNITETSSDGDTTYSADKTYAEIEAAYQAGRSISAVKDGFIFDLINLDTESKMCTFIGHDFSNDHALLGISDTQVLYMDMSGFSANAYRYYEFGNSLSAVLGHQLTITLYIDKKDNDFTITSNFSDEFMEFLYKYYVHSNSLGIYEAFNLTEVRALVSDTALGAQYEIRLFWGQLDQNQNSKLVSVSAIFKGMRFDPETNRILICSFDPDAMVYSETEAATIPSDDYINALIDQKLAALNS